MQQIFDLLSHKLKIAKKIDIDTLNNEQKDGLLESLMVQKKKQHLRMMVEVRLQQNISGKNVISEQDLTYVLNKSHQVMTLYDKDLPITTSPFKLEAIIELYVNFFNRQGFTNRAQEIQAMHRKKVCPKSLLPSTLLSWLVEWVRKLFGQYLKNNIHSLYITSRQSVQSIMKQRKPTQVDQSLDDKQSNNHKFLIIHTKKAISFQKRSTIETQIKYQTQKSPQKYRYSQKERSIQKQRQQWKITSASPSIGQSRSGSLTSILQHEQGTSQDNPPINKQVFYYSYSEEIQNMYKQLESAIPDLDINFVRQLKRGGRRKQVQKRIPQIAKNIIKHMQQIQQSINSYYNEYTLAHQIKKKHKRLPQHEHSSHRSNPSDNLQTQAQHKSTNQINTSQSNRHHLSERSEMHQKRKELLSSLSRKHRYNYLNEQSDKNTSYLLRTVQAQRAYEQNKYKSLDLSIGNSIDRYKKQPCIIVLNSPKVSSSLQIIQQKTSKMKLRSHEKMIKYQLSRRKQIKKQQLKFKSIDLTYNQMEQQRQKQHGLPLSLQIQRSSHIHLPKIKGVRQIK